MALTFATALGEWGRETLLAHPGAFTAGVFTHEGPSQDQINGAPRPRAPAPVGVLARGSARVGDRRVRDAAFR